MTSPGMEKATFFCRAEQEEQEHWANHLLQSCGCLTWMEVVNQTPKTVSTKVLYLGSFNSGHKEMLVHSIQAIYNGSWILTVITRLMMAHTKHLTH